MLDTVGRWQASFESVLGRRLVYAADEYYVLADRAFPALDAYDGCPQHENGIGMARTFGAEVRAALLGEPVAATGPRAGFFAWVDGAPADGYRAPKTHKQLAATTSHSAGNAANCLSTFLITGELGARVLEPLLADLPGEPKLLAVLNRFFGGNIGVTGLLTGADVAAALHAAPADARVLLPDVVLSRGKFLDDTTVASLPRTVEVIATNGAAFGARPAMSAELPVVAIVGRPNVGKSTLVNRIVGRRAAIVEAKPGITRDRKELRAEWRGRAFLVVDTGGWLTEGEAGLTGEESALAAKVSAQAAAAIAEADLVILVVDVATGVTDEDARVARLLQQGSTPVRVAVNKVDDDNRETDAWSFSRLGLGEPLAVSAMHGRLAGELLDAIVAALPAEPAAHDPAHGTARGEAGRADNIFSVAIVGRPNVGKSTLFNRLVGEVRAVVHDIPGTTRDAIDTVIETDDGPLRFVDTAGLRRKSRIDEPAEYYSLVRALEAIDRAGRGAVLDRRHRRRDAPGPASCRADRRRGHGNRRRVEQV